MTDTLFMPKSTDQCLSIYPLNEEGVGRIENQMNRYGEGNTRNPRKGGGYDIKGEPKKWWTVMFLLVLGQIIG